MAAAVSNRPWLSTAGPADGRVWGKQCIPQTGVWSSQSLHRFPAGNAPVPEGENILFNAKSKQADYFNMTSLYPSFCISFYDNPLLVCEYICEKWHFNSIYFNVPNRHHVFNENTTYGWTTLIIIYWLCNTQGHDTQ